MKSKGSFDVLARTAQRGAGAGRMSLLDEIEHTFHRFLSLPEGAAEAMALWAMFAHAFDAAKISPRLALLSPVRECGKTVALTVLNHLVPEPLQTGNMTAAAIYRVIEQGRRTLLLDEMDNNYGRGVIAILNSGHTPKGANVWRSDNGKGYSTWAPIALAAIGALPVDTLASRSIIIHMQRMRHDEKKVRHDLESEEAQLELLRVRISKWAEQNTSELRHIEPAPIDGLGYRATDNWRPLLQIADRFGGEWPRKARAAAKILSGQEEGAMGEILLAGIKVAFANKGVVRMFSDDLCRELQDNADDKFSTITQRQLSHKLKPFRIEPKQIRIGAANRKGYKLEWFEDAFARYVP